MFLKTAADDRPYHLGLYPLETLPRDPALGEAEIARPPAAKPGKEAAPKDVLGEVSRLYRDLIGNHAEGDVASAKAPVPDDLARRTVDVKGYAYFMNADMVGICAIPASAWLKGARPIKGHERAIVVIVEQGRLPETGNLARAWAEPAAGEVADMRAAEIAICIARNIRVMGFAARAHIAGDRLVDADRLAVLAGLAVRTEGGLRNPYLDRDFSVAVVTTAYALETDEPLARDALNARGFRYWLGQNGAMSGRERNRQAKRATHMSKYPMEQVKRVDEPTTLVLGDEIPRVPKRAAFFERALHGDLGAKAQGERHRFAFKQPHTHGMLGPMRDMVPLQEGPHNEQADTSRYGDPAANARALKSLSYYLGSDLTGICEVPRYAWYSHDSKGQPVEMKHKYAVVMLIDQEYDTMEGASGDDWISGAQSMRGYLRGAEIAGVMSDLIRRIGFPARSQTNVDSDVLHLPLTLLSGLGELSRIGELVLNPFVGPRFKSVVLTTDMPLEPDKPIDFGLQYFCNHCWKCARECPCDAIPWGDSVMFNGYEMWKIDAERCARYRLTNGRGSACGRCMKTCPLNKVVTADGPILERIGSWCGVNARWLKPLLVPIAVKMDDWLGHGKRRPVKKWWLDLEIVDGICVEPRKGVSERDLNLEHALDADEQKIAYYPASMMPVPNDNTPQPVDRKAALAMKEFLETPAEARARRALGGAPPDHYTPTPPAKGGPKGVAATPSVYGGGTSTGKAARSKS